MLEGLWNLGSYIVAISILVAFHEFGHFWVARRLGIKVLKYSIGFGKPIWKRIAKDGVQYQIGSIPLGGYVKLLDEREGEVAEAELSRAFNRQPVWARIAVFAAGPAFNFILAVVFYWALFVVGIPGFKAVVAEPPAQTVASRAGVHEGDRIMSLDGKATPTWGQLHGELLDRAIARGRVDAIVRGKDGVERTVTFDFSSLSPEPDRIIGEVGLEMFEPPSPAVATEVVAGSAAAKAGLVAGDLVLNIDGVPITSFQQLREVVNARPNRQVRIEYQRNAVTSTTQATLSSKSENGKTLGSLGIAAATDPKLWQDLRAEMRLDPLSALPAAIARVGQQSVLTLKLLLKMLVGEVSVKNISSPIAVAQVAGFAAHQGVVTFVGILAYISISLGILNLLPVPILDGGQIVFLAIEGIKGSPLSERVQMIGQQMGLVMLALLMGVAFFNDISRSFG